MLNKIIVIIKNTLRFLPPLASTFLIIATAHGTTNVAQNFPIDLNAIMTSAMANAYVLQALQLENNPQQAMIYLKQAAHIAPNDEGMLSALDIIESQLIKQKTLKQPEPQPIPTAISEPPAPEPLEEITKSPSESLVETYISLAEALRENQQHEPASIYLREALNLRPDDVTIMFDLANTLNMAHLNEEALNMYYRLLAKCPTHKTILYNTAYTLKKMGRITDAMLFYDATLEQDPEYSEALFSRSLAYLISGDFERGWPAYEARWKRSGYPEQRTFKEPMWDGSDLHGKTIYIYAEQGLGDTFQFIRYAKVLKEQYGARIIVSVQSPLVTIISLCPYIDKVISLKQQPLVFDYQIALMSLPNILKTTIATVPNEIPYLYADQKLVQKWKEYLAKDKNFKIGICWQGNNNYSTAALRSVVAAKSLSAEKFAKLLKVPGITLYSLQQQTGIDQLSNLPPSFSLHVFDGDFDNTSGRFMDTAGVIANLDLIITIDTSMAHFSAGLGAPTWVLLPNPADWRWLLNCSDTPWYPNMRLFRQEDHGDWDAVMDNITHELTKLVSEKNKNSMR